MFARGGGNLSRSQRVYLISFRSNSSLENDCCYNVAIKVIMIKRRMRKEAESDQRKRRLGRECNTA